MKKKVELSTKQVESNNKVQKLTNENGVYSYPIWNNIGDRIVFVKASENEFY